MTNTQRGILLMVASVALFAVQDGFSRYLAGTYNTLMVVTIRYWVFSAFVILWATRRPEGLRAAVTATICPPISCAPCCWWPRSASLSGAIP